MRGAYAICAIDRWSISGAYSICATHNTDRGGASGAHSLSVAHITQYAPLTCIILMAHLVYAPRITQDILSTTLLVGPTEISVAHLVVYAPLVQKISVEHISKCATSKY